MHVLNRADVSIPTVAETVGTLTKHTDNFGVPLDYDRMTEYDAYYTIKGMKCRREIIRYTGLTVDPKDFKDSHFAGILKSAGVVTGLLLTKKGDISLSAESLDSVVNTGLYSDEIVQLIKLYKESIECFKAVSVFDKIYEAYPISKMETFDNHRMIIVHPIWVPQNTGRIGAREPGIMNFGHNIHDVFTVPKGYRYIEVDSGQIEPRIIQSAYLNDQQLKKCTMLYNDAYYGYIHYCLFLTDEMRQSGTLDFQPIEITDEMKDLRKRFKTYGNATMYGSTENILNDPYKAAFIRYIGGHPNRVAWQHRCENDVDRGVRTVYSAFGTPIDITKGPRYMTFEDKYSKECISYLVRCSINNPIQATGADLMRYSVKKADTLLAEKSPMSHILQYVHDAGKFAVYEDDYDDIIGELKEITAYQVDDWIPIYAGVEEGVNPGNVPRFVA